MIEIIKADGTAEQNYMKLLKSRSTQVSKTVTESVSKILEDVREQGDRALLAYTEKFDGKLPKFIEVPREEIKQMKIMLTRF